MSVRIIAAILLVLVLANLFRTLFPPIREEFLMMKSCLRAGDNAAAFLSASRVVLMSALPSYVAFLLLNVVLA
ncbi:MAG: hypothetical protein JNK84_02480 [Phreatobacter sp.]|uniref:hypothetical protein n=1 Tax=Phreatobacter sp. TaxID=1966341 RepID=UPI001A59DD95|nr:hypothetical protein [Phreatobacter sp.]MBL8567928.1 hypothetical protein [Phreatobacter sp.]